MCASPGCFRGARLLVARGERAFTAGVFPVSSPARLNSYQDSFTALPVDRFSHSAALQYYQFIPDLSRFIQYASDRLCPAGDELCIARAKSLADAVSLDISYDAISHALKITALWPSKIRPLLVTSHPSCRTEVGVLTRDEPASLEPHELGIAGHLAVMGQDQRPSATLFSFPSRHRHSEATFSSSFLQPTGLHPTLQIQVTSGRPPVQDSYCSPHAYLTLPRTIFADRYQLADELFLRSKNLTALRHITQPVDLEAPDYALKAWGSAVLLELAPPDTKANEPWTAEVPLHLRYLSPGPGGYTPIEIPYPAVFWACTAEEGTKFPTSPFERVSLGYDGLFGPRTVFWHVDPQPKSGGRLTNTIKVPVLDTQKAGWVNIGSSVAILIGFGWLVWKLLVAYLRMGYVSGPLRGKKTDAEKKKQ